MKFLDPIVTFESSLCPELQKCNSGFRMIINDIYVHQAEDVHVVTLVAAG